MRDYNEANCLEIKKFWESKGLSDVAVCGWLANWCIESGGFYPNNAQNSYMSKWGMTDDEYVAQVDAGTWVSPDGKDFAHDACGMGYAQWTSSGRKQGIWDYARRTVRSIANSQMQLEYAYIEYTSKSFASTKNGLENATTAGECAVIIMTTYEKPASMKDPNKQKERADLAEEFYQKYYGGVTPEPKKNKLLALSAGHYLYTAGKRCAKEIDPTETREWVLNARIADMLTDRLMKYDGVEILRLDDPTGEVAITLEERSNKSNEHHADFYLAIHHNAGVKCGKGGGVVVYHYPLDRNKEEATALYNDVVSANGLKGNRSNPIVATDSLWEVSAPYADSLLLENGFMDSWTDTPIILTESFAEKTADGLCKFFVDMWGLQLKESKDASDILAEIESIRNNIRALEVRMDALLEELRSKV